MKIDSGLEPGTAPLRGDIAIVGMSCLFAGAPDLEAYWRNILSKVDAVSDPPAEEWDPKVFYDPIPNPMIGFTASVAGTSATWPSFGL